MRITSEEFRRSAFAQTTSNYPIILLTIDHDSFERPIRISSDPLYRLELTDTDIIYGLVSRDYPYYHYPFQINLPSDMDGAAPTSNITIDNISRELTEMIRGLDGIPVFKIEVVLNISPDVVEVQFADFELHQVTSDAHSITGDLVLDTYTREPYPAMIMDPSRTPGLF